MSDAILHVGFEPRTGSIVSVAGVTVLGIREAYTPMLAVDRRPTAMLSCAPPTGSRYLVQAFEFGRARAVAFLAGLTPSSASAAAAVADSDVDRDGPKMGLSPAQIAVVKTEIKRGYACAVADRARMTSQTSPVPDLPPDSYIYQKCYDWAFARGKDDRAAGRAYDHATAEHTDLSDKDPRIVPGCRVQIAAGYKEGYGPYMVRAESPHAFQLNFRG